MTIQALHLPGAASRLFELQRLTSGRGRSAWSFDHRSEVIRYGCA